MHPYYILYRYLYLYCCGLDCIRFEQTLHQRKEGQSRSMAWPRPRLLHSLYQEIQIHSLYLEIQIQLLFTEIQTLFWISALFLHSFYLETQIQSLYLEIKIYYFSLKNTKTILNIMRGQAIWESIQTKSDYICIKKMIGTNIRIYSSHSVPHPPHTRCSLFKQYQHNSGFDHRHHLASSKSVSLGCSILKCLKNSASFIF